MNIYCDVGTRSGYAWFCVAVVPLLVTVTVQSTDCGPLTKQLLVALTSGGPVGGGTITVEQMLVLLPGLGSICGVVTVAQLVMVPPVGKWKENVAVFELAEPGSREVFALQEIGVIGPAPGVQLVPNVPSPPVRVAFEGAPLTTSAMCMGLVVGVVPLLVTVIVQSTDWGPLTTQLLVALTSGPPAAVP